MDNESAAGGGDVDGAMRGLDGARGEVRRSEMGWDVESTLLRNDRLEEEEPGPKMFGLLSVIVSAGWSTRMRGL